MAAVYSNASSSSAAAVTRTRSIRVPANTGKPLAAQPATASSASSQLTASSAGNISLFLTNLRLLDLDQHPDWPAITSLAFTAKDSTHGQKKRIQCVEWALYQLFSIWDPEETRSKLEPFFPPADQVQSLNLRAGLLRALEQAKKNAVLGRDVVVRKTMLDECRGERLEELLAVFSSAVLKKVVAEQQLNDWHSPAISQTLALEHRGYSDDRTELSVLVLAHKVSLGKLLREKTAARAKFTDFSELLGIKERSIARRREQLNAKHKDRALQYGPDSVSDGIELDVWRTIRHNWSGNERWMETLLYGDATMRKDGLLTAAFDRVWRRVESGRLTELEGQHGSGLLEQLDARVKAQRERLEKWENFRQQMFGRSAIETTKERPRPLGRQTGIDLGFGAHESLRLGRMSPRKLPSSKPTELRGGYASLLEGLQSELNSIEIGSAPISFSSIRQAHCQPTEELSLAPPNNGQQAEEAISELSELEEELARMSLASMPRSRSKKPDDTGSTDEPSRKSTLRLHQRSSTLASSHPLLEEDEIGSFSGQAAHRSLRKSPAQSPARASTPSPRRPTVHSAAVSPARSPTWRPTQESPERLISPTQQMADQILASMDNTSPSPVKQSKPRHTLSLAERTRLSMARLSHVAGLSDDEPDIDTLSPSPIKPTRSSQSPEKLLAHQEAVEEHEDLVARTRRSMANFEVARQKAQLERRRSQRKSRQPSRRAEGSSYFPPVNEGDGEGDTSLVLAEELMGKEDEAAVFMSRPKIKTSPLASPTRLVWE